MVETIVNNYVATGSDVGTVAGKGVGAVVSTTSIGSIVVGSNQSGINYNFGEAQPICISGKVVNDNGSGCNSNQTGVNGVTITVYNSLGVAVASMKTSGTGTSAGSYSFTGLLPGTYSLVESGLPSGYMANATSIGNDGGTGAGNNLSIGGIVVTSGGSATGYTFGLKKTS